jgi:hypothetical protein
MLKAPEEGLQPLRWTQMVRSMSAQILQKQATSRWHGECSGTGTGGCAVRWFVVSWCLLGLVVGPLIGCAGVDPPSQDPNSRVISVACADNLTPDIGVLDWELRVVPKPIRSGETFSVTLDGVAGFSEVYLDAAQPVLPGGVQEVNLVDISATVHVRTGALGADVILTNEAVPYECNVSRAPCDPAHDSPSVPGARGNTDCQPENHLNPCGRFVRLPTSTDCAPEGLCAELGKTGPGSQCELNGFCITGDLQFPLEEASGQYVANMQGDVLFGWADKGTGATIQESGPNQGTWILPGPVYEEPTGPIGVRVTVGGIPVATECAMGVHSKGPLGVDSLDFLSSPTPDSALLSFPIEDPR